MPQGSPPARPTAEELSRLALDAVAGSREDINRFLAACTQYAYAAAIRLGRKHHGAEDSAQDATRAVWELLEGNALKPETVGGFIGTLVLRSAYATAQRRLRDATIAAHSARAREAPDSALEVETAEWAACVHDVVSRLPQLLRRAVELTYWDERTTRGIARELRKSQSSVIRLLSEAETALRNELRGLIRRRRR